MDSVFCRISRHPCALFEHKSYSFRSSSLLSIDDYRLRSSVALRLSLVLPVHEVRLLMSSSDSRHRSLMMARRQR